MGIQVHVDKKDLPVEWKKEIRSYTVNDCDYTGLDSFCPYCQGGDMCEREIEYLAVQFPRSGWCSSYLLEDLVFDNKNANHQFREELDEHNVPYVRG